MHTVVPGLALAAVPALSRTTTTSLTNLAGEEVTGTVGVTLATAARTHAFTSHRVTGIKHRTISIALALVQIFTLPADGVAILARRTVSIAAATALGQALTRSHITLESLGAVGIFVAATIRHTFSAVGITKLSGVAFAITTAAGYAGA